MLINDAFMNLQQKNILVCGIANERSIAAAIARHAHAVGARIIATCQSQRLRQRVASVLGDCGADHLLFECDVTQATQLDRLQQELSERELGIDGLVHAIAFGQLQDEYRKAIQVIDTDITQFTQALHISAHSLSLLCCALRAHLRPQAGVVALTYAGATQVKAGYNIMGIAKAALEAEIRYLASELGPQGVHVNGISAGPIRTIAAHSVPGFNQRLEDHAERSFIGRNVTAEDIAECATFLLSPASSAISGEIIFVDGGAHLRG
jgi:enoyl-[acyl-carrier protein] reductase I